MPDIAVVDYGMGNLRSVAKALHHVAPDRDIVVSADPTVIRAARRVVLPGQSAMPDCIRCLDETGLRDVVMEVVRDRPFLGICLGLQMLFDESEEGPTATLGVVVGRVVRFRDGDMLSAAGKRRNELAIREVVSVIGEEIPVQLGGGIRDLDTIERYLDDGITYVIIGTAAVKNPGFLHDACYAFPGHIIVGLDAREGKVATDGWSKMTGHDVVDLAKKFEDYGVEAVVYTDIGRDGMLTGVNIEATVKLARELKIPVIASGGIASIDDIKELLPYENDGIIGAIAGRALYEGRLDFKAALKAAKGG